MFTDGRDNRSTAALDDVIEFANEHGVALHPVALSNSADAPRLAKMAGKTGGSFSIATMILFKVELDGPPPAPVPIPTGVSASGGDDRWRISWDTPETPGGWRVTHYLIGDVGPAVNQHSPGRTCKGNGWPAFRWSVDNHVSAAPSTSSTFCQTVQRLQHSGQSAGAGTTF